MIFDILIYLLTAIPLSPGGSSTVHIYTQTIHRTTQEMALRILENLCKSRLEICSLQQKSLALLTSLYHTSSFCSTELHSLKMYEIFQAINTTSLEMLGHLTEQTALPRNIVAIYPVMLHTVITAKSIIKPAFATAICWCQFYTFTTVLGKE